MIEPTGICGAACSDQPRPHGSRFLLWRTWKPSAPRWLWVCLNPSTADATNDDPTVRRIAGFSQRGGAGSFELVNLISQRATDPRDLCGDPEPDDADRYIEAALARCALVVFAFGDPRSKVQKHVRALLRERDVFVTERAMAAGVRAVCLGKTADGFPRHPLYVPGATEMQEYIHA